MGLIASLSGLGANTNVTVSQASQSFIPTKSSLGYAWNNKPIIGNYADDLSTRNLVCEGIIPFNTYFAPNTNEEHVFLSQSGATFALNEIQGIPQKPVARSQNITITGQIDCTNPNSTITASIPAQEPGTQYNWQISNGLQIVAGAGTNQITVKLNGANNNVETISLSAITSCSDIRPAPITIQVNGVYYPADFTINAPTSTCNNTEYNFSATANINRGTALEYTWQVIGGTIMAGQGTSSVMPPKNETGG